MANDIETLKELLQEKLDEHWRVWQRDFQINSEIDSFLEKKDFSDSKVVKLLECIKNALTVPEDFEMSATKEETEKLNMRIQQLEEENQKFRELGQDLKAARSDKEKLLSKILKLEMENQKFQGFLLELKMLKTEKDELLSKMNDLEVENRKMENLHGLAQELQVVKSEKDKLLYKIKGLEAENQKMDKQKQEQSAKLQDKILKLKVEIERTICEKEWMKKKFKDAPTIGAEPKNNGDGKSMETLLNQIAKLEGNLINAKKELKTATEKLQFYQNFHATKPAFANNFA